MTTNTESPEALLLLCCSRTAMDEKNAERIKYLVEGNNIDWQKLIQLAYYHQVTPLLAHNLREVGAEIVPAKYLAYLQRWVHTNAAHNLRLTRELLKLLELFTANNISAIPFKGAMLANSVYGNLALRQFNDLDILIHKEDTFKVEQLLVERNYKLCFPAMSKAQKALHFQAACEYRFFCQDKKVAIEPHWNFTSRKYSIGLDPEDLWQRIAYATILGHKVPTFAPEDLLFILCLNGHKDCWRKLNRICDLAETIRAFPEMNWQWLLAEMTRLGCRRIFLLGLFLTREILGTELPAIINTAIALDTQIEVLAVTVRENLWIQKNRQLEIGKDSNFSLWDFQSKERWREKIAYCCNLIFKPNEGDAGIMELPPSLYFLYYLIRPLRLLVRAFVSDRGDAPKNRVLRT